VILWTGLNCLRIGPNGCPCEHDNDPSGHTNVGVLSISLQKNLHIVIACRQPCDKGEIVPLFNYAGRMNTYGKAEVQLHEFLAWTLDGIVHNRQRAVLPVYFHFTI
jgi:hypothetical protein